MSKTTTQKGAIEMTVAEQVYQAKAGATNPPPQSAQLLRMEDYRA